MRCVRDFIDTRTILLITVFGGPIVGLFVWGGRAVQAASQ